MKTKRYNIYISYLPPIRINRLRFDIQKRIRRYFPTLRNDDYVIKTYVMEGDKCINHDINSKDYILCEWFPAFLFKHKNDGDIIFYRDGNTKYEFICSQLQYKFRYFGTIQDILKRNRIFK